jgi:hypothetical protein
MSYPQLVFQESKIIPSTAVDEVDAMSTVSKQ